MALKDGFPSATGVADALDIRLGLAGLVVRDASGNPRTGIFPRSTTALVSSTATMNSSVAAFEAVVSRSAQGAIFLPNDGSTNVLHDAAPVSNKRLDIVYTKQNDSVSPNADANSTAVFGILKGTASASPTPYTYATAKAALAAGAPGAGAEPLAQVEIPSTATSMQSANVIYTQLYQYTATTGGTVWCRNTTERDAGSWVKGQQVYLLDTDKVQAYTGSAWVDISQDTTAWTAFPFGVASWVDFNAAGGTYQIAQYRKHNGIVEVRGLIKNGTATGGTVIGTLPVGFRPLKQRVFSTPSNFAAGSVEVKANGEVICGSVPSNANLSIEFSFAAEQ